MRSEQVKPVSERVAGIGWGKQPHLARKIPPQPIRRQRILWVDDSLPLLTLYRAVFESLGFDVSATSCPEDALKRANLSAADIVILDYDMPDTNGAALASLIKNQYPSKPVILYSGSSAIPMAAHQWIDAICPKGAPREELLATIERLSSGRQFPDSLPSDLLKTPPSSDHGAANHTAANN